MFIILYIVLVMWWPLTVKSCQICALHLFAGMVHTVLWLVQCYNVTLWKQINTDTNTNANTKTHVINHTNTQAT